MNISFADFSSSVLSMVQAGLSKARGLENESSDSRQQLFAKKLGNIIDRARTGEKKISPQSAGKTESKDADKIAEWLNERLGGKEGRAFLTELKNILLALSNGNLEGVTLNARGIDALKELLTNAGFDSDELDSLMDTLSKGSDSEKVSVDELFSDLFDLLPESEQTPDQEQVHYLDASALPFIDSVLSAMGIPREDIDQLLSTAYSRENGINLTELIEQLKKVEQQTLQTQTRYQTPPGDNAAASLLKQMGLDSDMARTETLSLNELISAFEKIKGRMAAENQPVQDTGAQSASVSDKTHEMLKSLFRSMEIEKSAGEKQVFQFSREQVKNQFENGLLLPDKEGNPAKGLFAELKEKTSPRHLKATDELAQSASLAKEKSEHAAGLLKDGPGDGRTLSRLNTARSSVSSDAGQAAAGELKSADSQAGQTVSKTATAFKSLPAHVTQQVSKSIVRAVNQGENILKIQLKPPELGRLMVTIDNSGNNMKVNIMTENASTREILVSNANELRSVLSNSGVNLERFEVDMGSDFRQSMADARQSGQNSGRRQNSKTEQALESMNNETVTSLSEAVEQGESLHFVA